MMSALALKEQRTLEAHVVDLEPRILGGRRKLELALTQVGAELIGKTGLGVLGKLHREAGSVTGELDVGIEHIGGTGIRGEHLLDLARLAGELKGLDCLSLAKGAKHAVRKLGAERSVGTLNDLEGHKGATPQVRAGVAALVTRRNPTKENAALAVKCGTRGIVRAAIEGIVRRSDPRTVDRARHAVTGLVAITVLGEHQIPPVAHLKEIRHLEHGVQARIPPVALELPGIQVLGGELDQTTGHQTLVLAHTRAEDEHVLFVLLIPKHKGIAPVAVIVTLLGRKQRLGDVLLPLDGVVTRCVKKNLLHQACLDLIAIATSVERMVLVAHLKHRAGINILVDFLVAATLKALAKVFVIDEVLGCRECPAKRLSERSGVSRVTLMIEIERAVLAVRHDVAYPNSLRLVIHLVHPRLPFSRDTNSVQLQDMSIVFICQTFSHQYVFSQFQSSANG